MPIKIEMDERQSKTVESHYITDELRAKLHTLSVQNNVSVSLIVEFLCRKTLGLKRDFLKIKSVKLWNTKPGY